MAFALCAHAGKAAPAASPDPDSAQEYFQRGNAFYKQCDYAHAMACYMRAQKTDESIPATQRVDVRKRTCTFFMDPHLRYNYAVKQARRRKSPLLN